MSSLLARIQTLVREGKLRVSLHGYRELAADDIPLEEIIEGVAAALPIEEYPAFAKGPCVLVLQPDRQHRPIHVVWGIAKDKMSPAVLVTAYRPDPKRWSDDFMRRSK
jgi:hypothetical protein